MLFQKLVYVMYIFYNYKLDKLGILNSSS